MWAIILQIKTKIKTFLYSIRWKILIAYLLIISIAFSVVAATLIQLVGDYMFNQRVRDDQRVAENLSSIMGEALFSLDVNAMLASAADASSEGLSRVLVLDRYGVVQVDAYSQLNGRRFENSEVANVLSGNGGDYGFYDAEDTGANVEPGSLTSLTGVRAMTGLYAAPIYNDGDLIGVLVYISQAQEIYESLRTLRGQTLLWMLLVAASALIISMFVVRTITRPIGELSAGISRMSRGDLSSRVEVRGKNEFAQLASAFNSMCERLEKLDMSRNQFVSNASHELKTPLSTMKILLETLLYQDAYDPQMQKEFLTDINKEIDRLNRIVSDLLTLVNIDSDGMHLNASELRLRDVVTEQVKRLSPLARERGIELSCLIRDPCETVGDSLKLQQVFYNVIDNAIKYTPPGSDIEIGWKRQGKWILISIADNGPGIPDEAKPHIFEMFYSASNRIADSRRSMGLGLALCKAIVNAHGGEITVSDNAPHGSVFTFSVPAGEVELHE